MSHVSSVKDDELIRSKKGLYIFGKDVREIPCMKSSLLFGITCGTFAGLISFMFTSKAAMSSHIGFGSLWVAVFAYWIPCRYNYENKKLKGRYYAAEAIYERGIIARDTPQVESEEEKKEQTV